MLCCVHGVNVLSHALHGCNVQDLTAIMVVMVMVRVGVVFGNK